MSKDIDFFYVDIPEARETALAVQQKLDIPISPLSLGMHPDINPNRGFIIFNGDGYNHHFTRGITRTLQEKRTTAYLPDFSYVHIDGHDDIASEFEGDDNSYKSFVLGIMDDIKGGVYVLEEGLTGVRDSDRPFIVPTGPEEWDENAEKVKDSEVYISIDFDVLDQGSGIQHLFPQTPIGFDMSRLLWNIDWLCEDYKLVGADLVGFSKNGANGDEVEESYINIARITERLANAIAN